MELGFTILCGLAAVWVWTMFQTRKAVRSYLRMKLLQRPDMTVEEADAFVQTVSFKEASTWATKMKQESLHADSPAN